MTQYLSLAPIALLLLVAVAMLIIRLARPRFAYFWLIAVFGSLAAWPIVFVSRLAMPFTATLGTWQPQTLFVSSPGLVLDGISWPFSVALTTLVLAVILSDVARAAEADWTSWAGSLILAAVGLFAVQGANRITVLLAWAAIDLFELFLYISRVVGSAGREQIIIAFSTRVLGIILLFWPSSSSLPAVLAVSLRLGVLPPHMTIFRETVQRRGLGTMVRLVPAAASLALLARLTSAGISDSTVSFLLLLTGSVALYAGFSWMMAPNELEGRSYWISGLASLAIASTLRGQPIASLAWGSASLFSGGLIFLTSSRPRLLMPILALGLLGFSTLPFTPAWDGVRLYAPPFSPVLILFLIAHALLLAGYIRHMIQPGEAFFSAERWVLLIYPLGLALLPVVHFVVGGWGWFQTVRETGWSFNFLQLWPGLLSATLTAFLVILGRRSRMVPTGLTGRLWKPFTLGWIYGLPWGIYGAASRLLTLVSNLLEGEGGVLWALLILALILAIFVQGGVGGG